MTVESEQYSVKYKGTGVANDTFPIPFSFRHTDALKVETIASDGTPTAKTISTHYDVAQLATSIVSGTGDSATNIITSNSQRTEYGWIKYKAVTTDIIHIYREETPLQDYDYTDGAVIPAEQFEKSADRVVDSLTAKLARSNYDPSKYSAQGRKITNLRTPVRNDDILTKTVLDSMGTTASLSIPASGGSGDNGKLLAPSGLVPSTPAVAWASRLGLPSTSGTTSLYVLSPVSDYANTPFVEWTIPRWIPAPPNDGLRSVYNYNTGATTPSEVGGEGTAKYAEWREFREMPATLTETTDVNKVIRLNSKTWTPPAAGGVGGIPLSDPSGNQVDGSYSYQTVVEPTLRTENQGDLRMVAAEDNVPTISPRMKLASITVNQLWDTDGATDYPEFGNSDGSVDNASGWAIHLHPTQSWILTNVLKNDSDALVMPQMVFMQAKTTGYTVPQSGAYGSSGIRNGHTAYPVYDVGCDRWDSADEYMPDYDSGGAANDKINGYTSMMNNNWRANSGDKFDDSYYLHFSSAQTMVIYFLLIYNSSDGV